MVADACQGGHNCSTVPYAFLLLSKIGCLKLKRVEKGFKTNFGVVAVFVLHVYSKMESCLEDLNSILCCHMVALVLIALLCAIQVCFHILKL